MRPLRTTFRYLSASPKHSVEDFTRRVNDNFITRERAGGNVGESESVTRQADAHAGVSACLQIDGRISDQQRRGIFGGRFAHDRLQAVRRRLARPWAVTADAPPEIFQEIERLENVNRLV